MCTRNTLHQPAAASAAVAAGCVSGTSQVRTAQPRPAALPLQRKPLKEGIAELYDESSGLWESMWGEHMHHG